jgi:hypothetical protein
MHKLAIYPQLCVKEKKKKSANSAIHESLKSTSDSGEALTPLPKKYTWYPNMFLKSPINSSFKAESP